MLNQVFCGSILQKNVCLVRWCDVCEGSSFLTVCLFQ